MPDAEPPFDFDAALRALPWVVRKEALRLLSSSVWGTVVVPDDDPGAVAEVIAGERAKIRPLWEMREVLSIKGIDVAAWWATLGIDRSALLWTLRAMYTHSLAGDARRLQVAVAAMAPQDKTAEGLKAATLVVVVGSNVVVMGRLGSLASLMGQVGLALRHAAGDQPEACYICHEPLRDSPVAPFDCGHRVCGRHLEDMALVESCPICRTALPEPRENAVERLVLEAAGAGMTVPRAGKTLDIPPQNYAGFAGMVYLCEPPADRIGAVADQMAFEFRNFPYIPNTAQAYRDYIRYAFDDDCEKAYTAMHAICSAL